jgi:hypothetical protein
MFAQRDGAALDLVFRAGQADAWIIFRGRVGHDLGVPERRG